MIFAAFIGLWGTPVSANADDLTADQAVANAITAYVSGMNGEFEGKYYKNGNKYPSASGCCAFANYVWRDVFGSDLYDTPCDIHNSEKTTSDIYGFLSASGARVGDWLWARNGSGKVSHHMIILSYDAQGFCIADGYVPSRGNGNGVVWHNGDYVLYTNRSYQKYFSGNCYLRLYHMTDDRYQAVAEANGYRQNAAPQVKAAIPSDAASYNGHHYYFVSNVADSFDAAEAYAEKLGGHMVTIGSREENTFVADYFYSKGAYSIWIGYSDKDQEGVWRWVNNEETTFTGWKAGCPYISRNHNTVLMYSSGNWVDYDFQKSWPNSFVIEWDF